MRGLITELRPAALDELGLAPALHSLVDRVAGTTGLEIGLTCDLAYEQGQADTRHSPELESTMYRLVQEALTNVVKHAAAGHVTVALIETGATVEVTVTDDGAGYETAATSGASGCSGCASGSRCSTGTWRSTPSAAGEPPSRFGCPSSGDPDWHPQRSPGRHCAAIRLNANSPRVG